MKKIISLILSFAMLLSLVVFANAAETPTATLTVTQNGNVIEPDADGVIAVDAGTEFEVTISYENIENIHKASKFRVVEIDDKYIEWNSEKTAWLYTDEIIAAIDPTYKSGVYTALAVRDMNGDAAKLAFKALDVAEATVINIASGVGTGDSALNFEFDLKIKVLGEDFTAPALQLDEAAVADREYDGKAHTLSVAGLTEAESDAVISYTITRGEETVTEIKDAGTYTVKAEITKTGYNKVTLEEKFTISPAKVFVTGITAADKVYDGTTVLTVDKTNAALSIVYEGDTVNIVYPETAPAFPSTMVGEYTIAYEGITLDNANYALAADPKLEASISQLAITIKADTITKTVDTDDPALTYTVEPALVEGDELTGSLVREEGEEVGEYLINQGSLAVAGEAAKNYAVTYVNANFNIIAREYTALTITTPPTNTTYIEDEAFDKTGMVVTATYIENGVEKTEVVENYVVAPTELKNVGTETVTITYAGLAATLEVTVNAKQIKEIALDTTGVTTEIIEGTALDLTKLTVDGTYDNGKTYDLTAEQYAVVLPEGLTADYIAVGEYTVTVKSLENEAVTATFVVNVVAKSLEGIEVTTQPTKTAYVEGQAFAKDGMVVTAKYNNGTTAVIDNANITAPAALTAGTTSVEVSYTEGEITKTAVVAVTVEAKAVSSIEIVEGTAPVKTNYIEGNTFDPTGLKINVIYNDGEVVEFTDFKGFKVTPSPLKAGTTEVVISYKGKSVTVSGITVAEKSLVSLEVSLYNETYVDGTAFDKESTVVVATYDNGDKENFSGYTVEPAEFVLADPTVEEVVSVTVSYKKDAESEAVTAEAFEVTVVPCVAENSTTNERYASLEDALPDAQDGETVVVQLDTVIEEDVTIENDVTLDLNGKNVTTAEGVTIVTDRNVLTINNEKGTVDAVISVNGVDETVVAGESSELTEVVEETTLSAIEYAMRYLQTFVFEIDIIDAENGTIKGRQRPSIGATPTFTITPNEGYKVADVLIDGKSVGAVTKYTFSKIRGDHTITAVFAPVE